MQAGYGSIWQRERWLAADGIDDAPRNILHGRMPFAFAFAAPLHVLAAANGRRVFPGGFHSAVR